MSSKAREGVRAVSCGYAIFSFMYLTIVGIVLFLGVWYRPLQSIEDVQLLSGTLIRISVMAGLNIVLAVATRKVLCLSTGKQRIVVGLSLLLALSATADLAISLLESALLDMPDWQSPLYTVLPTAVLAFMYGWFTWVLYRSVRISNTSSKRTAEAAA